MRKRGFVVAALGLAACLVAGGLFASNMGFKLNYGLDGPDGGATSATGTSTIALPFNQQVGLDDAADVFADLPPERNSFGQFDKTSNGTTSYTGQLGDIAFPIVPGEGYFVTVTADTSYVIVGSHNPALSVQLDSQGTNGSATGTTLYAYPYHSVAASAEELIAEIETFVGDTERVSSVGRHLKASNGTENYTGNLGDIDFPLVPGEAYYVTVNSDTSWVPAHY